VRVIQGDYITTEVSLCTATGGIPEESISS